MKYDISIQNLYKTIDDNVILNNINLNLEKGKIYGITGRNGSGKSMLFKSICGFLTPTQGKVIVLGDDIYLNKTFPKDTRALIEKPTFISSISGFENLKLLAQIQNKIGDEEIAETLKLVNLYDNKDKKYGKYSLGMKQKLGIAAVLMENPKIIILDEPFNGIDNESIKKIKEYFLEIKKDRLIVVATHIKQDLEDLCDEIYNMDNGNLSK